MKLYQRIAAAIDLSSHAQLVAKHAATLARELKAELIFVSIINQRDVDAVQYTIDRLKNDFNKTSIQKCIERLQEDRKNEIERLKESVDVSDLKTRFIIRTGVPFQEILGVISEENADMLVMGIKGRSDLADVMVGSTALKLFKRCPVPLVTVRKGNLL